MCTQTNQINMGSGSHLRLRYLDLDEHRSHNFLWYVLSQLLQMLPQSTSNVNTRLNTQKLQQSADAVTIPP
jgi:hypothetical protein